VAVAYRAQDGLRLSDVFYLVSRPVAARFSSIRNQQSGMQPPQSDLSFIWLETLALSIESTTDRYIHYYCMRRKMTSRSQRDQSYARRKSTSILINTTRQLQQRLPHADAIDFPVRQIRTFVWPKSENILTSV
jgi:hypothetical protein